MGYIPIFLSVGGACLLFFLTVKNSLQKKLNLQKELIAQLNLAFPVLGIPGIENLDTESIFENLKASGEKKSKVDEALRLLRQLKINRLQYNQLIKKPPYNWVAKMSGFQEI